MCAELFIAESRNKQYGTIPLSDACLFTLKFTWVFLKPLFTIVFYAEQKYFFFTVSVFTIVLFLTIIIPCHLKALAMTRYLLWVLHFSISEYHLLSISHFPRSLFLFITSVISPLSCSFIYERVRRHGDGDAEVTRDQLGGVELCDPSHKRLAQCLQQIGDELDGNMQLQR